MKNNFACKLIDQFNRNPEKIILRILINHEYQPITYENLISGASAYQNYLSKLGIGIGDIVILILPHGIDLVYAYFGCVLNGSIPSIMPYLTEKLIPEKYRQDLELLIKITCPKGLITFAEFSQEINFLKTMESSIKSVVFVENVNPYKDDIKIKNQFPGLQRTLDDVALLQHSSGTTGLQKGVALSHQAIFNQLMSYSQALNISDSDVIVSWLPIYHDMGLIAGFLMPIFSGIPLILMSPFDWVRAPYKLLQAISKFKGTLCWLPNFAYNFCAKKIRDRDLMGIDLSTLRAVINCSEPMRQNSHEMFYQKFKSYGFKRSALATSYAMAENVFAVTQGGIDLPINFDEISLRKFQEQRKAIPVDKDEKSVVMVSAGKPIKDVKVKIINVDGKYLQERFIGEIVIKSNCLLTEYHNREDASREVFINGWFKTGDYGYIADGELYISGRKKDLIIVGGKNIYPKDIETNVMEIEGIHPGRVVAFGVFNEIKGTEDVVVIAEIEPAFLGREDEITSRIRAKVTKESAIALRNVHLVKKKWLIKTSSGKIARALNKKKYIQEVLSR